MDVLLRQACLGEMCSTQPLGVRRNMSFVINSSKLSNWEDIKASKSIKLCYDVVFGQSLVMLAKMTPALKFSPRTKTI